MIYDIFMQYPSDEWHQVGIINKVNGPFFFFFWASKAIKSIKSCFSPKKINNVLLISLCIS